ncbi:MAG: NUDIX domain-containing protein [Verrucomicrobia bacterium]|nr:NUDIX domain-containing protein [Verrucomicrobiota bacterium]
MGVQECRTLTPVRPPWLRKAPSCRWSRAWCFDKAGSSSPNDGPAIISAVCGNSPGGKVESGETPTEGLRRELREELEAEVKVGDLIAEVAHAYPERRVHIQFFRCRLLCGEPVPRHCAAVAWVTPTELDRYPFPAADARLLERLRTEPGLWRDA